MSSAYSTSMPKFLLSIAAMPSRFSTAMAMCSMRLIFMTAPFLCLHRGFDQDVHAAGRLDDFAPSLLVDRDAVALPLGAALPLGVAGDQHRLVGVDRFRGG